MLRNELGRLVILANKAMEHRDHDSVEKIAYQIIYGVSLQKVIELTQRNWEDLTSPEITLALACLNMLRIWHVDQNNLIAELQSSSISEDEKNVRIDEARINILHIARFQLILNTLNLPPITIHDHPIVWGAENRQDLVRSQQLLGNSEQAIEACWQSITIAEHILDGADLDWYLDELSHIGIIHTEDSLRSAALSSLGVNFMRLAQLTENFSLLLKSLQYQKQSMKNDGVDRLIDVHLIILKYIKSHPKQAITNLSTSLNITSSTLLTFITHPKTFIERARLHVPKR